MATFERDAKGTDKAIVGTAEEGIGVFGASSTSGIGVYGASATSTGVGGHSNEGFGVHGISERGIGVHGVASTGTGGPNGEFVGRGVVGDGDYIGVEGHSFKGVAVAGWSEKGRGVIGTSDHHDGVSGTSKNPESAGVSGHNPGGLAGYFEGNVVVDGKLIVNGLDIGGWLGALMNWAFEVQKNTEGQILPPRA